MVEVEIGLVFKSRLLSIVSLIRSGRLASGKVGHPKLERVAKAKNRQLRTKTMVVVRVEDSEQRTVDEPLQRRMREECEGLNSEREGRKVRW